MVFGHISRRVLALRSRGDAGSTLVIAIMVGFVCLALGSVVVAQSIGVSRDSGRDRQRTGQIHAAESGVDAVYQLISSGTFPCRWPATGTQNVGDYPDVNVVSASVSYSWTVGATTSTATSANGCVVPTNQMVTAVITATSSSTNAAGGSALGNQRVMQSEAVIRPQNGAGYAIFSDSGLSVPNNFDLRTDGVNPADIYSNGSFNCTNAANIAGSVYAAQGGATLANGCNLGGLLYVRDSVSLSNSSSVAKSVTSSRGGLTLSNPASITGNVLIHGALSRSGGTISGTITCGSGCSNVSAATINDPPSMSLPYIGYDPTAWQNNGFTIVNAGTNCASIQTQMLTVTTPTLFYGNCTLNYSGNNGGQTLKTDVALFVTGGIQITNQFGLASNNATTRKLYIISPAGNGSTPPAGWSTATCTGGAMNFSNQTSFDQTINVFLYSCGTITMANNTGIWGQIYGKQVTVSNRYQMTYVGTPPIGVTLTNNTVVGYTVDVVYKREIAG
jgi:hypothetical protein